MFVSDLRHFLDMPDDAPGPARKMAEHLGSIVKAATASKTGAAWETALPCRRRPGNRPCPGHIVVFRPWDEAADTERREGRRARSRTTGHRRLKS
jgi:hypothetical protein